MAVNHLIDSSQFCARERQPTGWTTSEARSNRSNRETVFIRNIASAAQRRFSSSSGTELPTDADYHTTLPREQSPPVYPRATDGTPNVIIFGETGVGKSSLINMIAGTPSAAISSSAIGCTFESVGYSRAQRRRERKRLGRQCHRKPPRTCPESSIWRCQPSCVLHPRFSSPRHCENKLRPLLYDSMWRTSSRCRRGYRVGERGRHGGLVEG